MSRDGGAIVWRCFVAIPTFKEAASPALVVATVDPLPGPVDVIVMDDGLTDGTAVEIARVQQDLPIAPLRLAYNLEKGRPCGRALERHRLRWWCCMTPISNTPPLR